MIVVGAGCDVMYGLLLLCRYVDFSASCRIDRGRVVLCCVVLCCVVLCCIMRYDMLGRKMM